MIKQRPLSPRARDVDTLCAFLAVAAFLIQVMTVFIPHIKSVQEMPLQLNQSVLQNTAANYYQFQMYLQAPLLDWLWKLLPRQTFPSFSLLYAAYYAAGACGFLWALYGLCRRVASPPASALACLYLAALYPMFWYDNFFHPSDPWGAWLTTALVGLVLTGKQESLLYYAGLLASGFVWEKSIPLVMAAHDTTLVTCGRSVVAANAFTPGSPSRYFTHARVTSGSARSLLVSTLTTGFAPRISASSGLELALGRRPSMTSIITSCEGISATSSRRAFVMCPGYH